MVTGSAAARPPGAGEVSSRVTRTAVRHLSRRDATAGPRTPQAEPPGPAHPDPAHRGPATCYLPPGLGPADHRVGVGTGKTAQDSPPTAGGSALPVLPTARPHRKEDDLNGVAELRHDIETGGATCWAPGLPLLRALCQREPPAASCKAGRAT